MWGMPSQQKVETLVIKICCVHGWKYPHSNSMFCKTHRQIFIYFILTLCILKEEFRDPQIDPIIKYHFIIDVHSVEILILKWKNKTQRNSYYQAVGTWFCYAAPRQGPRWKETELESHISIWSLVLWFLTCMILSTWLSQLPYLDNEKIWSID